MLGEVEAAVAVAPLGFAERPRETPARIAVAYDSSPESEVALSTSIGLARGWDAP